MPRGPSIRPLRHYEVSDVLPPSGSPRRRPSRPAYARHLAPARKHAGRWVKLFGPFKSGASAHTQAANLRTGAYAGIARGEYDARARRPEGSSSYYVWVRYVGAHVPA